MKPVPDHSPHMKVVTLFDVLTLVGTLPALVWLLNRRTSNYGMERTGHG